MTASGGIDAESTPTASGAPVPAVYTIPSGVNFLAALAEGLRREAGDDPLALVRMRVLLPTRRACRGLREAFLAAAGGQPVLLPRMTALGDVDDDDESAFWGDETLSDPVPPAIGPLRRRLLLTKFILEHRKLPAEIPTEFSPRTSGGQPSGLGAAARVERGFALAFELARFLDQVQTERLPLDRLARLVPEEFAHHWQITLDFLAILTRDWPKILAAEGCIDPAERRDRMLEAQAKRWRMRPPDGPVVAAGSTGSVPATADLLAAIARLPNGKVILPGLDPYLDDEDWRALDSNHPQFALKNLIERIGVTRGQVQDWPFGGLPQSPPARAQFLSLALRPAETAGKSRLLGVDPTAALAGVERLECATTREEAVAIALVMREALQTPDRTAALVTADRRLARSVACELARWNVTVDDSAGIALADTPPGVYLRLIARMLDARVAPVAFLACLKHPLAAMGESPGQCRARVREIEKLVLRGPRPAPGFAGLRAAAKTEGVSRATLAWLDRLADICAPFAALLRRERNVAVGELLKEHVKLAENLAASAEEEGAQRLWSGEAGEALAQFVAELGASAEGFAPIAGATYRGLFDQMIDGPVVRPKFGRHDRLQILGPLEARLLQADVMILGGMNEGVWPPEAGVDPWLSRDMRKKFGLPAPERRIGLSAHDFVQAMAAPSVVITRALRVEGAPTVPSRWLVRMDALLGERKFVSPRAADFVAWQRLLDEPDGPVRPTPPPAPRPPVALRPRSLAATQIETLIRNPYAIYARHILKLVSLDPLDADPGAADRGSFIHRALDRFVGEFPTDLPPDAEARLLTIAREEFGEALARPAVWGFWWPRFERVAKWFLATEPKRRELRRVLATEAKGQWELDGPAGRFVVRATADRIDRAAGGLVIVDYKTGSVPSDRDIVAGLSPQLPIEAAIAEAGGFPGIPAGRVAALAHIRLSGGNPPGEECSVRHEAGELAAAARAGITGLVALFDDPATPYLAHPRASAAPRYDDYRHLARVDEWADVEGDRE